VQLIGCSHWDVRFLLLGAPQRPSLALAGNKNSRPSLFDALCNRSKFRKIVSRDCSENYGAKRRELDISVGRHRRELMGFSSALLRMWQVFVALGKNSGRGGQSGPDIQ